MKVAEVGVGLLCAQVVFPDEERRSGQRRRRDGSSTDQSDVVGPRWRHLRHQLVSRTARLYAVVRADPVDDRSALPYLQRPVDRGRAR